MKFRFESYNFSAGPINPGPDEISKDGSFVVKCKRGEGYEQELPVISYDSRYLIRNKYSWRTDGERNQDCQDPTCR